MAVILHPQVTEVGKQAAIDAADASIEIKITHISYGRGAYDPNGSETGMADEIVRRPIASGSRVTPTQLRVSAVWQDDVLTENVREIGFWCGAVLFAIVSRSSGVPYAIKTPGVDLVAFYDLALTVVPPNSVNVIVDPDASAVLAALTQHETDPDAHPQYLKRSQFVNGHALMWQPSPTGTGNALLLASPSEQEITAYVPGMRLTFKAAANNTGPATVNVNGLGVKDIRKSGADVLAAGDIKAGAIYDLLYDGTNFQLAGGVGGSQIVFDPYEFTAAAGQTNFTVSYTPGYVRVIRNGRVLSPSDYTATTGTVIALAEACNAGDAILIEAYNPVTIIEEPPVFGKGTWKVWTHNTALSLPCFFIPDNEAANCAYTFPTNPQDGDTIEWRASETPFSTYKMTLTPTDKAVMGEMAAIEVIDDYQCGGFVFRAALDEWRAYGTGIAGDVF